ncbi:hypothetical protein BC828DRAFT_374169 [Blastocladiella britannica]|nr:hypothetical protein BC828DRAFT_374169 [Blastocladiella britannica]
MQASPPPNPLTLPPPVQPIGSPDGSTSTTPLVVGSPMYISALDSATFMPTPSNLMFSAAAPPLVPATLHFGSGPGVSQPYPTPTTSAFALLASGYHFVPTSSSSAASVAAAAAAAATAAVAVAPGADQPQHVSVGGVPTPMATTTSTPNFSLGEPALALPVAAPVMPPPPQAQQPPSVTETSNNPSPPLSPKPQLTPITVPSGLAMVAESGNDDDDDHAVTLFLTQTLVISRIEVAQPEARLSSHVLFGFSAAAMGTTFPGRRLTDLVHPCDAYPILGLPALAAAGGGGRGAGARVVGGDLASPVGTATATIAISAEKTLSGFSWTLRFVDGTGGYKAARVAVDRLPPRTTASSATDDNKNNEVWAVRVASIEEPALAAAL